LSGAVQKVWSDRLVSSTTSDYAGLMQKILSRTFFDSSTQVVLESIMEWPMTYPDNHQVFNHVGQKGGSTSFVLTDAFYADLKDGNKLACAFFFNDLSDAESKLVNKYFGSFEAEMLLNKAFRTKLANTLK
jgi:D-alanyl-D-alanine carboxypeptidase